MLYVAPVTPPLSLPLGWEHTGMPTRGNGVTSIGLSLGPFANIDTLLVAEHLLLSYI